MKKLLLIFFIGMATAKSYGQEIFLSPFYGLGVDFLDHTTTNSGIEHKSRGALRRTDVGLLFLIQKPKVSFEHFMGVNRTSGAFNSFNPQNNITSIELLRQTYFFFGTGISHSVSPSLDIGLRTSLGFNLENDFFNDDMDLANQFLFGTYLKYTWEKERPLNYSVLLLANYKSHEDSDLNGRLDGFAITVAFQFNYRIIKNQPPANAE